MNNDTSTDAFEQSLVNQLARECVHEQRQSRRWGIFFKSLFALYILVFFILYLADKTDTMTMGSDKHTAIIDVNGVIAADAEARADHIITGLRQAFEHTDTAGVIIRINSPGGSPVQAGYVNDEINRLRQKYPAIPIYAVISDLCASGGYYIAAAADKIYANKASIVGSIGVILAGFGFVDTIEKLGIERRLLHAGENKGFMDPFLPLKQDQVAHVHSLLEAIHQQFKDVLMQTRSDRLQTDKAIFSGLIWTGEQSLELGLVDALGSAGYVAREVIGAENIVDFTRRENYLDRFAKMLGAAITGTITRKFELR